MHAYLCSNLLFVLRLQLCWLSSLTHDLMLTSFLFKDLVIKSEMTCKLRIYNLVKVPCSGVGWVQYLSSSVLCGPSASQGTWIQLWWSRPEQRLSEHFLTGSYASITEVTMGLQGHAWLLVEGIRAVREGCALLRGLHSAELGDGAKPFARKPGRECLLSSQFNPALHPLSCAELSPTSSFICWIPNPPQYLGMFLERVSSKKSLS